MTNHRAVCYVLATTSSPAGASWGKGNLSPRGGMLGAFRAVRRRIAMLAAFAVLTVCGVTAAPAVAQESGSDDEEMETASDRAVVELDFDVAHADAATLADALGDIGTNVADQVAALDIAQGNLNNA